MRIYGRLLRRPTTSLSLAAALLSAVPIGMWPLTVVLLALGRGDGVPAAGLLAAMFGVGNAVGVLVQGGLLVRVRAAVLLPLFALAGLPAVALLASRPTAAAGAVLAGLAIPAVTPAVRGRFATVLPGEQRPGAYALVNVLFQAGIAVGPLLAAALDGAAAIRSAPAIAAAFGLLAALLLAVAHRRPVPLATGPITTIGRMGPGAGRGVAVLFTCAGAAGFGIGVLQVLVPVRSGSAVAGVAFAALALAEVLGAVALGARIRASHAGRLLLIGTAGMSAVYLLVAADGIAVAALAALLGLATATQSLGSALLLDRFVPPSRLPAVFSAQIALLVLASAAGASLAGVDPRAAAVGAAGLLAVGAIAAAAALHPRPSVLAAAHR